MRPIFSAPGIGSLVLATAALTPSAHALPAPINPQHFTYTSKTPVPHTPAEAPMTPSEQRAIGLFLGGVLTAYGVGKGIQACIGKPSQA